MDKRSPEYQRRRAAKTVADRRLKSLMSPVRRERAQEQFNIDLIKVRTPRPPKETEK